MKILLVNLVDREFMPPSVFPLGIAYIASTLISDNHTVKLLDLNADRQAGEKKLGRILSQRQFDWIGISSIITQYKKVKELARKVKSLAPQTPLVLGGAGPTSHPELYLQETSADIIVIGEGEKTVLALCDHLANKDIRNCSGLAYKKNDQIYFSGPRQPVSDLDEISLPKWELFDIDTYLQNCLFKTEKDQLGINILTSRGCPGQCTYCMRNFGNRMRYRSVDNIMQEIVKLTDRYKINHIHFIDDTICSDKAKLARLAEEIHKKSFGLTWSANARVNQVTAELLQKMADSGCSRISYGIESADITILKEMKKGITPKVASKAIQWTRGVGIDVRGYFMIGFPSEDAGTIQNTVDFCKKNLVGGEFFFVTPFPGSEIYEYAISEGLIKDEDTYLQVAGEVRNFVINCTKKLDNETLFTLKEKAEKEICHHLKVNGIEVKQSIREDPRVSLKKIPNF